MTNVVIMAYGDVVVIMGRRLKDVGIFASLVEHKLDGIKKNEKR